MTAPISGCAQDVLESGKLEAMVRCRRNDGVDPIAILRDVQELLGYLPEPVLERTSSALGLSLAKLYAIATFYDEFYLEPRGRNIVRVCRGSACAARGGMDTVRATERCLGLRDGETGADLAFTFEMAPCFGNCTLAPVMMVNKTLYGDVRGDERVNSLLEALKNDR